MLRSRSSAKVFVFVRVHFFVYPRNMAARAAHILKKKESILSLEKHLDKQVHVLCVYDWALQGVLKGFDSNMNLVLCDATEFPHGRHERSRQLGAAIVRGPIVCAVSPSEGCTEVDNPF